MKKNVINLIPVFIAVVLFITVFTSAAVKSSIGKEDNNKTPVSASIDSKSSEQTKEKENPEKKDIKESEEELRAVWVPYMSLDMSGTDHSEKSFKDKIDTIVTNCKKHKLNAVIIHVRPCGDALYRSSYFPWSHILTGEQGKDPGYDPLEYIIQAFHNEDIEVHAWINPLRIRMSNTPSEFSDNNPYMKWKNDSDKSNDNYTFTSGDSIYYNPAYPEVRRLIINGIKEIVENYDVDAIHFDDYFYPEDDEDCDSVSYDKYIKSLKKEETPLSKAEWRKGNINSLISGVYSAIHSAKDNVEFGISPQCNIENDEKLSADIYSWGSIDGYVDYICPQIYVSNEHPVLPFSKSADQWRKIVSNKNVKLYLGLGIYKAGTDKDNGTWLLSDDILKEQILYGRSINCNGFMLYSYDYLDSDEAKEEIANVMSVF